MSQPKVSALRHYILAGCSVERLMNLLTALDQDVEIVIGPFGGRLLSVGFDDLGRALPFSPLVA